RFIEDDHGIHLIGEDTAAVDAKALALDARILGYLVEHIGPVTSAIQKALKVQRDFLNERLEALARANKIDCMKAMTVPPAESLAPETCFGFQVSAKSNRGSGSAS